MHTAIVNAADGPGIAASLRDLSEAESAVSEDLRTLSPAMVEALWDTGLMNFANVADAGGCEPTFVDLIDTWIELAWQDGSLGWTAMANHSSTMSVSAHLSDAGFAEVFGGREHRVTMGGQLFPNGAGNAVEGGYRLTGAWNFGSGTAHSAYVGCGFIPIVEGDDEFDISKIRVAVVPRDEVNFTDGWYVQGLRGTGSYDYSVEDVFVPEDRCFPLFSRTPSRGGSAMGRMGVMGITAAGHAAWALGVSKSMLDDVAELALTKARMSDMDTLANRQTFQRNLAHHTAMWRAARAGTIEIFTAVEAAVADGAELTPTMRADFRSAATYATEASREVAQWAHLAAGTSAIRNGSRLERAFRDLYTGSQHAFISEKTYIDAAQIWLGLEEDLPGL